MVDSKFHLAEILLIAIILFDGIATLSSFNQQGYWYNPSLAFVMEGNPLVAQYASLGPLIFLTVGFAYLAFVVWLYHKRNPLRFPLLGVVLSIHLVGGLSWLIQPFTEWLWANVPNFWYALGYEALIGIGLGLWLQSNKKWKRFLDKEIRIPV